ncbi:MAG: hypothetical protein ACJA0G_001349 [Kangiellaceae bacterium]|jgi:hypothetical protein
MLTLGSISKKQKLYALFKDGCQRITFDVVYAIICVLYCPLLYVQHRI